jgi:hypothetical protein
MICKIKPNVQNLRIFEATTTKNMEKWLLWSNYTKHTKMFAEELNNLTKFLQRNLQKCSKIHEQIITNKFTS